MDILLPHTSSKKEAFAPIDYLANGRNCIELARLLIDGPNKIKNNYPMRVLLVHGIELLLKAFIQHFDKSMFTKRRDINKGHNIKELHRTAEEIDRSHNLNVLTDELKSAINKVVSEYYPDSVKARYTNFNSSLDFSLFMILKELLIQPLEKVIHL